MAIPPIGAISGAGAPAAPGAAGSTGGGGKGFSGLLTQAVDKLDASQNQAATASQNLATGATNDITSVAMQVEQASLSLQLAVQVRNKLVDAYDTLFGMQI
jgi:flagellar hook-basal body complex protein FliE